MKCGGTGTECGTLIEKWCVRRGAPCKKDLCPPRCPPREEGMEENALPPAWAGAAISTITANPTRNTTPYTPTRFMGNSFGFRQKKSATIPRRVSGCAVNFRCDYWLSNVIPVYCSGFSVGLSWCARIYTPYH